MRENILISGIFSFYAMIISENVGASFSLLRKPREKAKGNTTSEAGFWFNDNEIFQHIYPLNYVAMFFLCYVFIRVFPGGLCHKFSFLCSSTLISHFYS